MSWDADRSPVHRRQVRKQVVAAAAFVEALVIAGDPDLWMEWYELTDRVMAAAHARVDGTERHEGEQEPTNGPEG